MPGVSGPPHVRYGFADAFAARTVAERRRILEAITADEKQRADYWRNSVAKTLHPTPPPRARTLF